MNEKMIAMMLQKCLEMIWNQISPEIHALMADYMQKMEEHANSTVNPWDDLLVSVLRVIVGDNL